MKLITVGKYKGLYADSKGNIFKCSANQQKRVQVAVIESKTKNKRKRK